MSMKTGSGRRAQRDAPHAELVTIGLSYHRSSRLQKVRHHGSVNRRSEVCHDSALQWKKDGVSRDKRPRSIAEEHVVGIVAVHILSLMPMCRPANGPSECSDTSEKWTNALVLWFNALRLAWSRARPLVAERPRAIVRKLCRRSTWQPFSSMLELSRCFGREHANDKPSSRRR
jgi:hypothetical protein